MDDKTEARDKWIVVTTINSPTKAIAKISELCRADDWSAVVVGDVKTPENWASDNIHFLDVTEQDSLYPELSKLLPKNHYCRKNLGYLYALDHGACQILETDDDNLPGPKFGCSLSPFVDGEEIDIQSPRWVNPYLYFTDQQIWPRGLPLEHVRDHLPLLKESEKSVLVQQYLADGDPDVDAVHRLIFDADVTFSERRPIIFPKGAWCPFNSQNTAFFDEALPLMYLPSYVSFRMTDIWRSFVVQASLWAAGECFSMHSATVFQERNPHNLLKDFEDEVPGYLNNSEIKDLLEQALSSLDEPKNMAATARQLWGSLITAGIIPSEEEAILDHWFSRF
jgi:hypothetical protein